LASASNVTIDLRAQICAMTAVLFRRAAASG
jgi:hypothetical protein